MSLVLHRKTKDNPEIVESADGIYLHLKSGRRVLDGSGGAAVACLGHGRKDVAAAIQLQMARSAYVYSGSNLSSQPVEQLAKLLVEGTDGKLTNAFFCSSGSEATEAAIKLALQYWMEKGRTTRTCIVARHSSYHGNTLGALSASYIEERRKPYQSWMSANVEFTDRCFPYRDRATGQSEADYVEMLAADLNSTFQRIGPQNVAAFLLETVSGTSLGCVLPPKGYLKVMRTVCRKYDILLILDEVMCGMGRTGSLHAWQAEDFDGPDIQTIGKSLGGGYIPLSAVLVSRNVVKALSMGSGRVAHSQTFQAHPLACAAAFAVQNAIRTENLIENVQRMGMLLGYILRQELSEFAVVGDIRGRGLFWAVEFVADKGTKLPLPCEQALAGRVVDNAFRHGLCLQCGMRASSRSDAVDCIIISPPYNVSETELSEIVRILKVAIHESL